MARLLRELICNANRTNILSYSHSNNSVKYPLKGRILWASFLYLTLCILTKIPLATTDTSHQPTIISIANNDSRIPIMYPNLPRVGKCCHVSEYITKDENGVGKCVVMNSTTHNVFSPQFSEFNASGVNAVGHNEDSFVALIGDPCEYKRYMLEPEISSDDAYFLLLNGSIFGPNHVPPMLTPGIDYCMEIVPGRGLRVLVCFHKDHILTADFRLTFYACGLLISVPFLILTIMAYCITPKLMDVHGKAVCHYCGCLTIAFTTLAISQLSTTHMNHQFCVTIAFIIQLSFIACFFWLNVISIETYLLVRRYMMTRNPGSSNPNRLFFYYSLWAWLPSAALIIVSMIHDLNPTIPLTYMQSNFSSQSCWFEPNVESMPFFYVPIGLLIAADIVLFAKTAAAINRHQQALDLQRLREDRQSNRCDRQTLNHLKRLFFVCLSLFSVVGLNWTMGVISWMTGGAALTWSAFDLVNAFQGILIFSVFILRKSIRQLVWHQINHICSTNCHESETNSMERSLLTMLNMTVVPNRDINSL